MHWTGIWALGGSETRILNSGIQKFYLRFIPFMFVRLKRQWCNCKPFQFEFVTNWNELLIYERTFERIFLKDFLNTFHSNWNNRIDIFFFLFLSIKKRTWVILQLVSLAIHFIIQRNANKQTTQLQRFDLFWNTELSTATNYLKHFIYVQLIYSCDDGMENVHRFNFNAFSFFFFF